MKDCCQDKASELNHLQESQASTLKAVLAINAVMFLIEFYYGWKASSNALLADSLDMLGDTLVYGFSLYVLDQSFKMKNRAAQLKGGMMLTLGLVVLSQAVYKLITGKIPHAETMGVIAALAILGNVMSLILLYKHRTQDINMKSTWICSRNDIISNVGIILAAGMVKVLDSMWPDVIAGLIISALFISSAVGVLREATQD